MNDSLLEQARRLFAEADHIAVIGHVRPDGDAVGSVLGLGLALLDKGKHVQMVLADGVPRKMRHLAGADQVQKKINSEVDLWVTLDCSDLDRVGKITTESWQPDINIDHHVTNLNFAKLNLVDETAVATATILAESLPVWDLALTNEVASALLMGLITDTLGFRTSNMTPQALRIAAELMEAGADLPALYNQSLVLRSYEALRLWGGGLMSLQRRDRLVWASLTLEDRRRAGYAGRDDADLINQLSAIRGFEVALIFVEQSANSIKVSWRAVPGVDVAQVALQFGGGGHPAAAGAVIPGDLETVQIAVLETTHALLGENGE